MNITVYRGSKHQYQYSVNGNVTARKLTFVVKADKGLTSSRLVQKKNTVAGGADTQVLAVYDSTNDLTVIKVFLLPTDTGDFTSTKYYFDLRSEDAADSADSVELDAGDVDIILSVQTPYDNTDLPEDAQRYIPYVIGQLNDNEIPQYDEGTGTFHGVTPGELIDENFYNKSEIDSKEDALESLIGGKVDKESDKGLSTNDFTDELKTAYDTTVTNSPTADQKAAMDTAHPPSATNRYLTQKDIGLLAYNDIGVPGTLGFGVGICPPSLLPAYMLPMPGCYLKGNDYYGNYQIVTDGSIMVWIPAFWYKVTHDGTVNINKVDIKPFTEFEDETEANTNGYVIHRAFIDGGAIKEGVFVDKYKWSLTNAVEGVSGIASSIPLSNPISSSSASKRWRTATITGATHSTGTVTVTAVGHGFANGNSVAITGVTGMTDLNNTFTISGVATDAFNVSLTTAQTYSAGGSAKVANYPGSFSNCISNSQTPSDTYGGAWAAAKSRGNDFAVLSIFISTALALLSFAHGQMSTSTVACAWYHSTNNFPQGNNNSGADYNDSTCTFAVCDDAYWATRNGARKNGSGTIFAKTTHNGQNCGVADINGNQWEIVQGLTAIGTPISISLYTSTDSGTKVQITTSSAHGLSVGSQFGIDGATDSTSMNGKIYTVTDVVDATNIKVASTVTSFADPRGSLYKGTFYALKESIAIKNVTGGNSVAATDHFADAFITANMDVIAVPFVDGAFAQRFGNSTNQVLPFNTSRAHADYKLSALGLPKNTSGISTSGTNQFGQDYYYQYFRDELCSFRSGSWHNTTYAGAWYLHLFYSQTVSLIYASARACLYV